MSHLNRTLKPTQIMILRIRRSQEGNGTTKLSIKISLKPLKDLKKKILKVMCILLFQRKALIWSHIRMVGVVWASLLMICKMLLTNFSNTAIKNPNVTTCPF